MKIFKFLLSFLIVFAVIGPSFAFAATTNDQPVTHRTVESFVADVISQNQNGSSEITGTKKVNSITEIREENSSFSTKIVALEDYYDLDGQYINSKLKVDEFTNDYITGKANHSVEEKDFTTQQTLDNFGDVSNDNKMKLLSNTSKIENLTSSEQTNVGNYLESLVSSTKDFKSKKEIIDGITLEKKKELNKLAKELKDNNVINTKNGHLSINQKALQKVVNEQSKNSQVKISATSMEMAGAFDNYYNHDTSTGKFTIQALSASPHKYIKYTGTTYKNSLNASSMTQFKSDINNYENYIVQKMNSPEYWEVGNWFFALMGLATLVAGFATGPGGWVAIVINSSSAFGTFYSLTSAVYASYARLNLSQSVAYYCQSARDDLYYKNWSGVTASVVSGY